VKVDPLITVAMAMRNAERTLPQALASLLAQTYPHWELVLLDDGSSDSSVTIAQRHSDGRITVHVDGAQRGLATRLNQAIALARGSYLARMDADDVCYPERFARQVEFLQRHPEIDLLGTGAMVFANDGAPVGLFPVRTTHEAICRRPWAGFYLAHPTWMGRLEWFRRFRYDEGANKAQDQDMLLRAYDSSRFAALPETLLGYRQERISFGKVLAGRYHFSRAILRKARSTRAAAFALRGLTGQAMKTAVDAFAIGTGLSRQILSHRARPFPATEAAHWQEVWRRMNGAGN
jgi:glycosyltransferase involved in cell wall biosynthesis